MGTDDRDDVTGGDWSADGQLAPPADAAAGLVLPQLPTEPSLPPQPSQPLEPSLPPQPSWTPQPSAPPSPTPPVAAPGYAPIYPGYSGQAAPGYTPAAWPPQPAAPGYPPGYPGAAGYPPGYGPGYPGSAYPNVPPAFGYPGASWPGSQVQYGPAPGLAWAGMGHRIGALLLDILFMFGALIVAAMAAEAFGVKRYSQVNTVYSTGATISYLLWVILFLVYQPTCWWAFQGTVGQRLLRLRVVRAADGRSLGAGSTTVRFIIWGLCNVVVVPAIIAAIVAQDEPTQRTWWDDAAGSVVIRQL